MKSEPTSLLHHALRDFTTYRGPWLKQPLPSNKPVAFLPEILDARDRMAFGTVFNPAGDAFYFGYEREGDSDNHDILESRRVNGVWSTPIVLPFNSDAMDGDHCLSHDGNRMFWRSWQLLSEEIEPRSWSYLWWAERTGHAWSEARLLKCGREKQRTGYPAIGQSNTLYFAKRAEDGDICVARSRNNDGVYETPEEIIGGLNIGGDLCVAPDESYLIITEEGRPENIGKGDLFVSFQLDDGSWSELRHMGDVVNTAGDNASTHCAMMSPDAEYLFYRLFDLETRRGCVFWMSTRSLDALQP